MGCMNTITVSSGQQMTTESELRCHQFSHHKHIDIYCTITIYYGSMVKWIIVR